MFRLSQKALRQLSLLPAFEITGNTEISVFRAIFGKPESGFLHLHQILKAGYPDLRIYN